MKSCADSGEASRCERSPAGVMLLMAGLIAWAVACGGSEPAARERPVSGAVGATQAIRPAPGGTSFASDASLLADGGIRIPEYDEIGRLKSELCGESAHQLSGGVIEVRNLRINFYKGGQLEGYVETPRCYYKQKDRLVYSEEEVFMHQGNLLLGGVGFQWQTEKQVLEVRDRSFVIIKDALLWAMREKVDEAQ